MIVISDTSPLLYLFLIDLIELLPQLYGQIIIPEVIRDEMIDVGAPTDFRNWAMEPPSWLTVISVTVEPNVNLSRLDPGEQAAK
jgi:predicted nucleic acid-binding protein